MNNKKYFLIANIILALLVLVGDACYIKFGELWLKGVTSAGFVIIGGINLAYLILNKNIFDKSQAGFASINKKRLSLFPIIMLVGLVFAMAGDIVLNVHFIGGAVLFAIGHVFYFASYCFLSKFKWIDLLYGAIIFVPSVLFITLAPIFKFDVLMEVVCVVYAIIISCMVGKAISNLVRERNLLNLLIVIGSALFFFSDLMLLLNVFASLPRVVDILCLATYYPAQCLLAFSIFIYGEKKECTIAKENKE